MKFKNFIILGVVLIATFLGLFCLEKYYINKTNESNVSYEYIYKQVDEIDRIGDVIADRVALKLSQDNNIVNKNTVKGRFLYTFSIVAVLEIGMFIVITKQNNHDKHSLKRHESTQEIVLFSNKKENEDSK